MTRLAIVSSHPIQYNASVFRALAAGEGIVVKVFFSWRGTEDQLDVEFGRKITWDIPLINGYSHAFITNHARDPGTHHFMGLRNPEMRDEIAAFDPDVVLVYGWSSWTHLSVLRRFKNQIPLLFRGDSTLISSDRRWKALVRKPSLTWIYRHIDQALYVGRANRDYFLAHGVPDERLSWAPHSIENDRFTEGAGIHQMRADAERSALGIPVNATVFLFAGKFVPRKQPLKLIESFQKLAMDDLKAPSHLVLVGTGPLEQELRNMANGQQNIHFVGFKNQSEMPICYRIGDVLVLPSSRETWGLAVNEAMASGRPVIVSDKVGCAPDLVAGTPYGTVFSSNEPAALTNALKQWCVERPTALAAGALAAEAIMRWSPQAAAKAIADAAHRAAAESILLDGS